MEMSREDLELPTEDQLAKLSPEKRAEYDAALQQLRDKVAESYRARDAKKVRQVQDQLRDGYDAAVSSLRDGKTALTEEENGMPQYLGQMLYSCIDLDTARIVSLMQSIRRYRRGLHELSTLLLSIKSAVDQFQRMSFSESQDPQFVKKLASLLRRRHLRVNEIPALRSALDTEVQLQRGLKKDK